MGNLNTRSRGRAVRAVAADAAGAPHTDAQTAESESESSDARGSPSDCIQRQKYLFVASEDGHMAWLASGISSSEDSAEDEDLPFTVDFGDDATSSLRRIETMASVTSRGRVSPRNSRTSAPSCAAFRDGTACGASVASAAPCTPVLLPGFTQSEFTFEIGPSADGLSSGMPSARAPGDETGAGAGAAGAAGTAASEPAVIARDMSMDLHPVVMARRRSQSFAWGNDTTIASPSFVTVSPRLGGAATPLAGGAVSGLRGRSTALLHSPITSPHPRRPALTLPPLRRTTAAALLGAVTPISCPPHPLPPLRVASTEEASPQ